MSSLLNYHTAPTSPKLRNCEDAKEEIECAMYDLEVENCEDVRREIECVMYDLEVENCEDVKMKIECVMYDLEVENCEDVKREIECVMYDLEVKNCEDVNRERESAMYDLEVEVDDVVGVHVLHPLADLSHVGDAVRLLQVVVLSNQTIKQLTTTQPVGGKGMKKKKKDQFL